MDQSLLPNSAVAVGAVRFGNELPLALIAGPCALESRARCANAKSTGEAVTQLWETGKLNSMPKAAQAPR